MLAHIEHKLEVAVAFVSLADVFLNLGTEFLFALHYAFAVILVKEFLIELGRHEAADLVHLEREVARVVLRFFLCDAEERSEFCLVVVVGRGGVERDNVVLLRAVENGLLVVVFEISRHERSRFHLHAAFEGQSVFAQFGERAAQDILILVSVYAFGVAGLLAEAVHFGSDVFFLNLNIVVRQLVAGRIFDAELGSEGDVELKLEVFLIFDVLRLLLLVGERRAEHGQFVFFDIVEEAVVERAVHFFVFHLCAVHSLHKSGRHVSLTETGHLCHLGDVFEFLGYFCFVVSFFDVDSNHCADVACLVK